MTRSVNVGEDYGEYDGLQSQDQTNIRLAI